MGSHKTRLSMQLRDRWCHGAAAEDNTAAGFRISESGEREAVLSVPAGTGSASPDAADQEVIHMKGGAALAMSWGRKHTEWQGRPQNSTNLQRADEWCCGAAAKEETAGEASTSAPSTSGSADAQDATDDNSAQPSSSSSSGGGSDVDIIDVEGSAALATSWGRKLRDWVGEDWTDLDRIYVVKPAAVGLASVPGEFVFIVAGLPQVAVTAFFLLGQVLPTSFSSVYDAWGRNPK